MGVLTLNEEVLLLAILKLKDNAYPVSIRKQVIEMTKKNVVYGTLYNSLDILLKKGYVTSKRGDPAPERGGKSKIFFSLSNNGITALKQTIEFHRTIWEDAGEQTLGLNNMAMENEKN